MILIYLNELEVKNSIDTQKSAYLEIDNREKLKTNLYNKCDNFIFPLVNIPASPAYRVNISQLLHYSRACAQYSDFLGRAQLVTKATQTRFSCFGLKALLLKLYNVYPFIRNWLTVAQFPFLKKGLKIPKG